MLHNLCNRCITYIIYHISYIRFHIFHPIQHNINIIFPRGGVPGKREFVFFKIRSYNN